ncbi:MAG: hypothetical protein HQM09_05325 [Candidatus Riflebacteria bacterium]|nr:hypothetical protein [Candidatus Riflebacteria bacterium]
MTFRFACRAMALSLLLLVSFSGKVSAIPEIVETGLIHDILQKNLDACNEIRGLARAMEEVAHPFTNPRYAAKYRFAPNDERSRSVMSLSRAMGYRFKTLTGILCNANLPQRGEKFKAVFATVDTLTTLSKRSIRAIRDGNFALYLASTQTLEKEAEVMVKHIADIETMINLNIESTDKKREEF